MPQNLHNPENFDFLPGAEEELGGREEVSKAEKQKPLALLVIFMLLICIFQAKDALMRNTYLDITKRT